MPANRMPANRSITVILLLFLLSAIGYSIIVPLGEGPDEADHYAYTRYIGLNRSLPEGPTVTQGKHPPLYHGLAAALTAWTGLDFDFLRSNPDAFPPRPGAPPNFFVHTTLEAFPWEGGALALHLARFLSIIFGAVTVWATFMLGRELFPERPEIWVASAIFLVGLPGYLVISGVMNNDNAAGAFGALGLFVCACILSRGITARRSVLLGIIYGLGLLSKVGTLALWPLAILAIIGALWPKKGLRSSWGKLVGHLAIIYGLGLLVASPWLLRNWRLYGDPLGWELVRTTVDQRLEPLAFSDFIWLARGLYQYLWGRFGPIGQAPLPQWLYILAGILTCLVLLGTIAFLWRSRHRGTQFLFSIALLLIAPALVIGSIVRYSYIALGTDQARLMWPAISAIAVWFGIGVAGWADLLQRRLQRQSILSAFGIFMVLFGSLTLVLIVRPAFAPPGPIPSNQMPSTPTLSTFGDHLQLLSAELPEEALNVGESVPLQLVWQSSTPLTTDLRPVVRLYHSDGWLAAEWSHSPAQGRYATDRWRPNQAILDTYELIPDPVSAGTYKLVVGVRLFRGEWLPIDGDSAAEFLPLGNIVIR